MFNRSKVWAVALLAAVFLAGAAVAWGVDAWSDRRHHDRPRGARGVVEYLDDELDLRPAQRDSVHEVFARYRSAMDSIWTAVHPRVDSLRSAMRSEINALLDTAQRDRYAQLIARRGHHHRRLRGARDTSGRPE
jgi:hypothetical protein